MNRWTLKPAVNTQNCRTVQIAWSASLRYFSSKPQEDAIHIRYDTIWLSNERELQLFKINTHSAPGINNARNDVSNILTRVSSPLWSKGPSVPPLQTRCFATCKSWPVTARHRNGNDTRWWLWCIHNIRKNEGVTTRRDATHSLLPAFKRVYLCVRWTR